MPGCSEPANRPAACGTAACGAAALGCASSGHSTAEGGRAARAAPTGDHRRIGRPNTGTLDWPALRLTACRLHAEPAEKPSLSVEKPPLSLANPPLSLANRLLTLQNGRDWSELDRLSNTTMDATNVHNRCYMRSLRSDAAHHTHPTTRALVPSSAVRVSLAGWRTGQRWRATRAPARCHTARAAFLREGRLQFILPVAQVRQTHLSISTNATVFRPTFRDEVRNGSSNLIRDRPLR